MRLWARGPTTAARRRLARAALKGETPLPIMAPVSRSAGCLTRRTAPSASTHPASTYPIRSCSQDSFPVLPGVDTGGALVCDGSAKTRQQCRPYEQVMMNLIQCLFLFKAWFTFELVAEYIPGWENVLANDHSRDCLPNSLLKAQSPDPSAAPLHPALPGLLLDCAGWTSRHRTRLFASIAE